MKNLSLVIITKNEEKYIQQCILSARDIVDEVIVIDDYSTDKTKEIVEALGAKYILKKWAGFGLQKQYAVGMATHDWLLSLDADEQLSTELKNAILTWKKAAHSPPAFRLNRLNFYAGAAIKYSGWYPDRAIRLWNRQYGNWNDNTVHEAVKMQSPSDIGQLNGDILHYTIDSITDHINRTNTYTTLQAQNKSHKSWGYLYFKLFLSPLSTFTLLFVIKRGFLDSFNGLMIASISAMGKFWTYAKAIKIKRNK